MRKPSYYVIRGAVRFLVKSVIATGILLSIFYFTSNMLTATIGAVLLTGIYFLVVRNQNKKVKIKA